MLLRFGLPLIIGGILLGWYNWARFGSVFEFGFRYHNYHAGPIINTIMRYFLLAYFPANLYVYFFTPPNSMSVFPFIKPAMSRRKLYPLQSFTAQIMSQNILPALSLLFPFIVFGSCCYSHHRLKKTFRKTIRMRAQEAQPQFYRWLLAQSHWIAPRSYFRPLLLFFYATQRFLEDFTPLTFLIATLGFWQGYSLLNKNLSPPHCLFITCHHPCLYIDNLKLPAFFLS